MRLSKTYRAKCFCICSYFCSLVFVPLCGREGAYTPAAEETQTLPKILLFLSAGYFLSGNKTILLHKVTPISTNVYTDLEHFTIYLKWLSLVS